LTSCATSSAGLHYWRVRHAPNAAIVLIVIAAVLVVGVKVVAPKPGSLRSDFTAVKTAVPSGMKSFPNELLPR